MAVKSSDLKFKNHFFSGDKIKYIAPNWEETGQLTFKIASQIINSGFKAERLIALAKGGWTWSRALADYLSISKASSFELKFYTGIDQKSQTPVIVQSLPISVQGEKIILFDDVSDSGETLKVAKKYLKMCGAREIRTATLFYKPWSMIEPDFWGAKTKAWVIFPHEVREAIREIGRRWLKNKVSEKEIINRFLKIGLPKSQVKFFVIKDVFRAN